MKQTIRKILEQPMLEQLILPYRRFQHRKLLKRAIRSDSHTYTSFYRSPLQLQALVGPIIDSIDSAKKTEDPINILLFACSNGAEPYTIASAIRKQRPAANFHIEASDLHESMVEKARSGCYSYEEIAQGKPIPQSFIDTTFDKVGENYHVKQAIKEHVNYGVANLLDTKELSNYAPADIVVLQNVLFHMDQHMAEQVFNNVITLMKPSAYLFIDGMGLDRSLLHIER